MTSTHLPDRPRTAWRLCAALTLLAGPGPLLGAGASTDAERLIQQGDYAGAVTLLEGALASQPTRRDVLAPLARAYHLHAADLLARGELDAAEAYFRRLLALDPKSRCARQGLADVNTRRRRVFGDVALVADLGRWDEALARCDRLLKGRLDPRAVRDLARIKAWAYVGKAEGAFGLQDFGAARRWYDRAAATDGAVAALAADRRAYSHLHRLVDAINGGRHSAREWAELDAKVRAVLEYAPENGYGHYLLGVVLQNRGSKRLARSAYLKAAGARGRAYMSLKALREAAFKESTHKGVALLARHLDPRWRHVEAGRWQTLETTNFRIVHRNLFVARKTARAAEFLRRELSVKWYGRAPAGPWRPKCEIHIFASQGDYLRATGRSERHPAHSLISTQGRRVLKRRIDCRQDDPEMLRSVVGHELTHVVTVDHVVPGRLPRWADEGMAVLAEHPDKRARYERLMLDTLSHGRGIPLRRLLALDRYPAGDRVDLFYAQSLSLVEFLLTRVSPVQFVAAVRAAGDKGGGDHLATQCGFGGLDAMGQAWERWVLAAR